MILSRSVAALATIASANGSPSQTPTAIPRFTIWFSEAPTAPTPAMFESKFYLLVQGAKQLVVGGNRFDFAAGRCAVSSVGLPMTSQVTAASRQVPYIGVELKIDPTIVASLLLGMPELREEEAPTFLAAQATADLAEPLERLVRLLATPADIPVLAHLVERELCYRLLQSPMGVTLRQTVQKNTRFAEIRTAVEWICSNSNQPICVSRLAALVGMSVTSFHRHFKAVTACSPLTYQRHLRMLKARPLIASGATNITAAAHAAGYTSSSQFSREYKRMFGVSPIRDAPALRQGFCAVRVQ